MGSVIGKRMKAFLAIVLSVAMVLALNPASAMSAWADNPDPQPNAGEQTFVPGEDAPTAPEGSVGDEDSITIDGLSGQASTSVQISTYSTFSVDKYRKPASIITYKEAIAASEDVPNSYYRVALKNGAPDAQGKYVATWSWTKTDMDGNDVPSAAGSLTQEVNASDLADISAPIFTMTMKEGPLAGLSPKDTAGTYKVSVSVQGVSAAYPDPFDFNGEDVLVLPESNTNTHLTDNYTTGTGSEIDGGFGTPADLYVTDLLPTDGGSNNAYNIIATNPSLGGSSVDAIWQLDVVNDSLIPDENLVTKVTQVKMPLGASGADIAQQSTIKIASLVNGEVHIVEYTRTSADGVVPATFTSTGSQELTATITQESSGWYITFPTAGLGEYVGVYAVATPIPENQQVTVTASAVNGTITPAGATTIKSGSDMEFTLAPAEGYILDPAPEVHVYKTNASGIRVEVMSGFAITGNVLKLTNVQDDLEVEVTFNKPEPDDPIVNPPANDPFTLNVDIVNETVDGKTAAGAVTVVRTKANESAESNPVELTSTTDLAGVEANTSVFLTFGQVGNNNTILKSVEIGPDANNLVPYLISGTSYTFTMTANTQYIKVTFEPGIPSVTATQTITGTITPDGGGNFGEVNGTPVTNGEITKVTYGDYARITVNANDNYTISGIRVVPAQGDPWDVAVSSGATSQTVTITEVTCDYTIEASFAHDGIMLTTLPATTNGGSLSSVVADGETLSPVAENVYKLPYGASVTVSYDLDEGFALSGIMVNGQLQSATGNSYTFTANAAISLQPIFASTVVPPNPEKYSYVTVMSDGHGIVTPSGANQMIDAETGKLTLNFDVDPNYPNYKPSKVKVSYAGGSAADVNIDGKWSWEFDVNSGEWANWDTGAYTIYVEFAEQANPVNPPAESDKATITITSTAGGQVTPAGQIVNGEHKYEVIGGTPQSFTFVPDDGNTLSKIWLDLGDGEGLIDVTNNPTYVNGSTITFTPAKGTTPSIFVEFKSTETPPVAQFVVTTKVTGNGTISPANTTLVQAGAEQAFSIVPAPASDAQHVNELTQLLVNGVNMTSLVVNNSITLTINADTTVEATFAERILGSGETPQPQPKTVSILAMADKGGSVSPTGTQTVVESASQSFTFSALTGYTFTGMDIMYKKNDNDEYQLLRTVNATSMNKVGATYSFTAPAADYIKAGYTSVKLVGRYTKTNEGGSTTAPNTYTITATQSGIGDTNLAYITPAGQIQLAEGASQTFYFVTTAGYEVKTVRVDGEAVVTGVSEYTISGIKANTTIDVEFGRNSNAGPTYPTTYTVNVNTPSEGGSVSPSGSIEIPAGEKLTLTFIPDENYIVESVTVGGEDVTGQLNGSTYTIDHLNGDVDVDVTFKKIPPTATDPGSTEVEVIGGTVSPKPPIITNGDKPGTTIVIQPNDPDDLDNTIKNGKITVTLENGITAEITLTDADKQKIIEDGWTLDTGDIADLEGAKNAVVVSNPNSVVNNETGRPYAKGDTIDLTAKDPVTGEPENPIESIDKVEIEIGKGEPGKDPTTGQPDPNDPNSGPSYPTNSGNNKGDNGDVLKYATVNTNVLCNGVVADGISAGGVISPASSQLAVGKKDDGTPYKYTYIVSSFEGYYLKSIPTLSIGAGSPVSVLPDFVDNGDGSFTLTLPESASGIILNIDLEFAQDPTHVVADTYKINVSSNAGGKVQPAGNADGDVIVAAGGMQSFSFIPDEGYQLDYITIKQGTRVTKLTNIGPSYTISGISSDMQLIATFVEKPTNPTPDNPIKPTYETFKISASSTVGGELVPSGDTTVNSGASLSFTVRPATGYRFSYLTVDGTTVVPASNLVNNQYTLTNIKADHTVSAVFVSDSVSPDNEKKFSNYKISVIADSDGAIGGYVTPSGTVSAMQGGSAASVKVQPYFGYEIESITIKRAGEGDELVNVTNKAGQTVRLEYRGSGDYQLQVLFKKTASVEDPDNPIDTTTRYVITSSVAGGNGFISPAGTQTVAKGSSQTFTVIPNDGYKLGKVTVNGEELTGVSGSSFEIHEIDSNMTIVVQFTQLQPGETKPTVPATADVIATATGPGSISPAGTTTMEKGKTITYTLTPNSNCKFANLTVNGVDRTADVKANLTYEFVANSDAQIVASFADANGNTQVPSNEVPIDVIVKAEVRGTGQQLAGKVVAAGGKISNNGATTVVNRGDSVDFVIMPEDGYYAASAYYESDGKQTPLAIRPLNERGTSGATASKLASGGRAVVPAAALSSLPEAEGLDVASLLGIEKAYAAVTVQKTYSFVTVPDVQSPIVLYIEFLPCEKDPNNPNGDWYSYEDQRNNIITMKPEVNGGATTKPSLNDIIINLDPNAPSVKHELAITPATPGEYITDISIIGETFPPDYLSEADKEALAKDPERFAEEFNNWVNTAFSNTDSDKRPHLEPTYDANGNPDGGYKLTIDDQIFKDNLDAVKDLIARGEPIIKIGGSGSNGVAYIYDVGIEIDTTEGGTIVVIRGDDTTRTYGDGETIRMNHNGIVKVIAYPDEGYQAKIETEGGVQEQATPAVASFAAMSRAAVGEEHNYAVTGAGKIKASFVSALDDDSYSVKTVVYGHGSVSPSGTSVYSVDDPSPVYTLTPDTNYRVTSIKINGAEQSGYSAQGGNFAFPLKEGGTSYTLEVTFGTGGGPGSTGVIGSGVKTLQSLAQTGDLQMPLILILAAVACLALGTAIISTGRRKRDTARAVHRR